MTADDLPHHDRSTREPAASVFDMPAEVGPLISTASWRESSSFWVRLVPALVSSFLVLTGYVVLTGRPLIVMRTLALQPSDWVLGAILTVAGLVIFGPARHCTCLGRDGLSMSRLRFPWKTSRRVLRFSDADDVETKYTRIVSDHVSLIYTHTEVAFSWLDKQGREVFRLDGEFYEPGQRTYDSNAPLDLSYVSNLERHAPAVLGFAAVDAFRAFKDQREQMPYR